MTERHDEPLLDNKVKGFCSKVVVEVYYMIGRIRKIRALVMVLLP
jgi:hypothetical protein